MHQYLFFLQEYLLGYTSILETVIINDLQVKRGLFLIVLEITVINLSWFGNYNTLYLQVIWAIGICMACLSAFLKLPRIWSGIIGLIIILVHNALTPIQFAASEIGYSL